MLVKLSPESRIRQQGSLLNVHEIWTRIDLYPIEYDTWLVRDKVREIVRNRRLTLHSNNAETRREKTNFLSAHSQNLEVQ